MVAVPGVFRKACGEFDAGLCPTRCFQDGRFVTGWDGLPPVVRRIAESTLTDKQLVAYRLSANGLSEARIAVLLRISRRAVRDRLLAADIRVRQHPDYPEQEAA